MERKTQHKMNITFKEFYQENYLVQNSTTETNPHQLGEEERMLKLFGNLINLYKGLKLLKNSQESAGYIMFSLKPLLKLLNTGIRNNNSSQIDFSKLSLEQIKMKMKGLTASINLGLNALAEFYAGTDNDRMKNILNKAVDKFSTTVSLMERI